MNATRILGAFLIMLLAGLLIINTGTANPSNADSSDIRVKITADGPADLDNIRQHAPVRHDFGDVVTATVTRKQMERLERMNGVTVSPVGKSRLLHHRDGHDRGPGGGDDDGDDGDAEESDRPGTPINTVPYGIKQIYNDSDATPSGGNGVTVAVLDTGVDRNHPDLERRVTQCKDFTKGRLYKNGCEDQNGHGTHVAGTILADTGEDGAGIYGVAPDAALFAYKVCKDNGCWNDDIAAAIDHAAAEGAHVVSMSLGADSESSLIRDAIERNSGDVLFVAAGGNDGQDGLGSMDYPAANPHVVGVAAINADYIVASFSSNGVDDTAFVKDHRYMEVSAAGVDVESTCSGGLDGSQYDKDGTVNGYCIISGTSMATPHVAGFAAHYWSSDTDLSPDTVRQHIRERASRWDITQGEHAHNGYDPASGVGLPTIE